MCIPVKRTAKIKKTLRLNTFFAKQLKKSHLVDRSGCYCKRPEPGAKEPGGEQTRDVYPHGKGLAADDHRNPGDQPEQMDKRNDSENSACNTQG